MPDFTIRLDSSSIRLDSNFGEAQNATASRVRLALLNPLSYSYLRHAAKPSLIPSIMATRMHSLLACDPRFKLKGRNRN